MEVVVLRAGKEDDVITGLISVIQKVLEELQINVVNISLDKIPYYDGNKETIVEEILAQIENSQGVVMASRVELLTMSGSMCSFFEHCSDYRDTDIFHKPLLAITSSDWRGEREVAEDILNIWDTLGGIEFGKLGIYKPSYEANKNDIVAYLERMTEDFYRTMKQSRPSIKSSNHVAFLSNLSTSFAPILAGTMSASSIGNKEVDIISKAQEEDIEFIANIFKKQLQDQSEIDIKVDTKMATYSKPGTYSKPVSASAPVPKVRTVVHMIKSLPHYFQAQYATNFSAVIQYNLLGSEAFQGYIQVKNGSCIFDEGVYIGAEIELSAEEDIFRDIFTKKLTLQKAFMLGQLKVRGNFMLLSRIDQMFKAL